MAHRKKTIGPRSPWPVPAVGSETGRCREARGLMLCHLPVAEGGGLTRPPETPHKGFFCRTLGFGSPLLPVATLGAGSSNWSVSSVLGRLPGASSGLKRKSSSKMRNKVSSSQRGSSMKKQAMSYSIHWHTPPIPKCSGIPTACTPPRRRPRRLPTDPPPARRPHTRPRRTSGPAGHTLPGRPSVARSRPAGPQFYFC